MGATQFVGPPHSYSQPTQCFTYTHTLRTASQDCPAVFLFGLQEVGIELKKSLPLHFLARCCSVCTIWKTNIYLIWDELDASPMSSRRNPLDRTKIEWLIQTPRMQHLKRISFGNRKYTSKLKVDPFLRQLLTNSAQVLKSFHNVTSLCFNRCGKLTGKGLEILLPFTPNLKKLQVDFCTQLNLPELILLLTKYTPDITCLTFSSILSYSYSPPIDFRPLTKLERLVDESSNCGSLFLPPSIVDFVCWDPRNEKIQNRPELPNIQIRNNRGDCDDRF